MNWHHIGDILTEIVKWLSAVGAISIAINKWAVQPFASRIEMIMNRQIKPIEELIKKMERQIELSERDRNEIKVLTERNQELINQHEKRLDHHNDRLIRLEAHAEFGRQTVKYKEEYLGGGECERTL